MREPWETSLFGSSTYSSLYFSFTSSVIRFVFSSIDRQSAASKLFCALIAKIKIRQTLFILVVRFSCLLFRFVVCLPFAVYFICLQMIMSNFRLFFLFSYVRLGIEEVYRDDYSREKMLAIENREKKCVQQDSLSLIKNCWNKSFLRTFLDALKYVKCKTKHIFAKIFWLLFTIQVCMIGNLSNTTKPKRKS